MFSTMLREHVSPVIAYASSGFFDLLQGYVEAAGVQPDSAGCIRVPVEDFAIIELDRPRFPWIPPEIERTEISLRFDDPDSCMREVSRAVRVRDPRPVANAFNSGQYPAVMESAFFNGDGGAELKRLEKILHAAAARKPEPA